jgi:hypothetical protein
MSSRALLRPCVNAGSAKVDPRQQKVLRKLRAVRLENERTGYHEVVALPTDGAPRHPAIFRVLGVRRLTDKRPTLQVRARPRERQPVRRASAARTRSSGGDDPSPSDEPDPPLAPAWARFGRLRARRCPADCLAGGRRVALTREWKSRR